MLVLGQHRSAELAERHRRSLQRLHPKAKVSITERSTADGTPSNRGHFFTFSIRFPKKNRVYIISVKWKTRRFRGWGDKPGYSTIVNRTMDIVVITRDEATDRQIIDMTDKLPVNDRRILKKVMKITMRGDSIAEGNAEISMGQKTSDPPGAFVRGFVGI